MNLVLRSPTAALRNLLVHWLLLALSYLDAQPKKKPHWGSTPYIKNRPALLMQDEIALALGHPARALIFQKVTEWCSYNQHANNLSNFHDGHWWTRMPYSKWAELIRWRNERTLRADIRWMEKKGVLISAQFRTEDGESDKWYRVDSGIMDALLEEVDSPSPMDSVSSRVDKTPRKGVEVPTSITTKNPNLKSKTKASKLKGEQQQHFAISETETAVVVVELPPGEPKGESGEHSFDGEGRDTVSVKAFVNDEQHRHDAPIPNSAAPLSSLAADLIDFGVAPVTAQRLATQHGETDCRLMLDHVRTQRSLTNPPGFLVDELDTKKHGTLAMLKLKAVAQSPGRVLAAAQQDYEYDQQRLDELEPREHIPPLPEPVGLDEIASGKMTARSAWATAYHQLSLIDRPLFEMSLRHAQLIGFDPASVTYTVSVPTAQAKELLTRYYRKVQSAVAGLHTAPVNLVFEVIPPLPVHQQPLSASELDVLHRLRESRALA